MAGMLQNRLDRTSTLLVGIEGAGQQCENNNQDMAKMQQEMQEVIEAAETFEKEAQISHEKN